MIGRTRLPDLDHPSLSLTKPYAGQSFAISLEEVAALPTWTSLLHRHSLSIPPLHPLIHRAPQLSPELRTRQDCPQRHPSILMIHQPQKSRRHQLPGRDRLWSST